MNHTGENRIERRMLGAVAFIVALVVLISLPESVLAFDAFRENGDGTVMDKNNRQWMRCSLGQTWDGETCRGEALRFTMEEAITEAEEMSFAGQSDWRLPTVNELKTLVYCSSERQMDFSGDDTGGSCIGSYKRPTIDERLFPGNPPEWFWTSATGSSGGVYYVSFANGAVITCCPSHSSFIRLVRTED